MDGRLVADLAKIGQVSGRLGWVEREFTDTTRFTRGDAAFLGSGERRARERSAVPAVRVRRGAKPETLR